MTAHHRHPPDSKCQRGNVEANIHAMAKEMLAAFLNLWGSINFYWTCEYCCHEQNSHALGLPHKYNYVTEYTLPDAKFDVAGVDKVTGKPVLNIEVYHTHRTTNLLPRQKIQLFEAKAQEVVEAIHDLNEVAKHSGKAFVKDAEGKYTWLGGGENVYQLRLRDYCLANICPRICCQLDAIFKQHDQNLKEIRLLWKNKHNELEKQFKSIAYMKVMRKTANLEAADAQAIEALKETGDPAIADTVEKKALKETGDVQKARKAASVVVLSEEDGFAMQWLTYFDCEEARLRRELALPLEEVFRSHNGGLDPYDQHHLSDRVRKVLNIFSSKGDRMDDGVQKLFRTYNTFASRARSL